VTAQPGARSGPSPLIRALGRVVNTAVARLPWSWRLVRGPVRRFVDSVAAGWDERVRSDSAEYLIALRTALDRVQAADPSSRVRFVVADIASFEDPEGFDLIAMLNMPPFFDRVVALLRPGGFVVNASSYGSRTTFFTPPGVLERDFQRRGLRTIAVEQVGMGTCYVATRAGVSRSVVPTRSCAPSGMARRALGWRGTGRYDTRGRPWEPVRPRACNWGVERTRRPR
jgi:hypothetical protein